MRRWLAFAGLCAVSLTCLAQEVTATVFGLPMGKPVTLPVCKLEGSMKSMCLTYEEKRKSKKPYTGPIYITLPDGAKPLWLGSVQALLVEDRLEWVRIRTFGLAYQLDAMRDLQVRFGKPTAANFDEVVSNKTGQTGQALWAQWATQGVLVDFKGVLPGSESGWIRVETPAGRDAYDSYLRTQQASGKSIRL